MSVSSGTVTEMTMASENSPEVHCVGKNIPRAKRKLQKHLRSAGLEYVSRTGKIIPAKQVAEDLCQCPQKCNDRVPMEDRENLFKFFYQTLGEAESQNKFLRSHMDVRMRARPLPPIVPEPPPPPGTRPPRRITCRYLLPCLPSVVDKVEVCQKAFCSAFVISTKRVRLQREKLIHSLGLNSYHHQKNVKKKRKVDDGGELSFTDSSVSTLTLTNLEMFANERIDDGSSEVTGDVATKLNDEIEIQIDRKPSQLTAFPPISTSRRCLVDNPLIPMGISVPEGVTIVPVVATPDHDRDIAIVNNFFSNQLWKPEYIGAHS